MAEAGVIKAKKMSDEEILKKVIKSMGLTETYHKDVLDPFFQDIKFYLAGAGIAADVINSSASVGVFIRGISDLWNYGTGSAALSPYFKERVIQLSTSNIVIEEEAENGEL